MKTPEGYVLVPVEPTREMIANAQTALWMKPPGTMAVDHYSAVYRAMLSAAPRDKALVEEGGFREALEAVVAAFAMNNAEPVELRDALREPVQRASRALSALSTKDMGLSRDLSQTVSAATPKSAATEQVKP